MNYIPLGIKTHYELLSSLVTIDSLINYTKNNNIDSIGIVDSNLFYVPEFYDKCIHNNIKPIIGLNICGIYLYAIDYKGYKNLCRLTNNESVTLDDITKYNESLLPVVFNKEDYIKLKEYFTQVYYAYNDNITKQEALDITNDIVYINESYYIFNDDEKYLKYLYLIKENKNIDYIKEFSFDNYIDRDISIIDSENTKEFSNLFHIDIPKRKFVLPKYCLNSTEKLNELSNKGLYKRLNGNVSKVYLDRLKYELNIINDMGFVDYFLIVYDFILYSKKNGIYIGPGRGSAGGSLVSYSLGITEIDPIKYNLIFERFLNPSRVTLPDIDIDVEYIKREEVINYIINKYGVDHVCNIITFNTYSPKQSIIDIGKVLDINVNELNRICKYIKVNDTFSSLNNNKEFNSYINNKKLYKDLIDICSHIEGLKKSTSIHAAGIIIDNEEICENAPIYYNDNKKVVGYTKDYLEYFGLLKIDLLSLENLTTLRKIVELIKEKNNNFSLNNISLNNQRTFDIFNNKLTLGIFQFDSKSMCELLNILNVNSFDDIVALNALNRPGPRDNAHIYSKNKNNKNSIKYIIPELENILSSTYGVILYQEQIMEIFKTIADYSYSEADSIRRAISKKKEDIILSEKDEFIKRLANKNISFDKANEIYSLIIKFANYGFNKSHSVSYSYISYYLAYLKAYYPYYFYKVLLDNNINNSIIQEEIIKEAKIMNVEFEKLDINKSDMNYKILNNKLVFPLTIIKDINKDIFNNIINERNNGEYSNFISFAVRNFNEKINKDVILILIKCGLFDKYNNRKTLEMNLNNIINYIKLYKEFGNKMEEPEITIYEEYLEEELYKDEIKYLGFSIFNNPITKVDRRGSVLSKDLEKYFDKYVSFIGIIDEKKDIITKNGENMCFINCSDEYGYVNLTIFPKIYKNANLKVGDITLFKGHVEKRINNYQIIVNEIKKIK